MILQDLRYALRSLRRHSLVTSTIVITLGLGIGAQRCDLLAAECCRPADAAGLRIRIALFAVRAGSSACDPGNRFSGPMFERLRAERAARCHRCRHERVARVHIRVDGASETRAGRPAVGLV